MNKTININLDGLAFKIEEEAYEKLDNYLETIKKRLGNNADSQEVTADIEARTAELFQHKYEGCTIPLSAVEEIIRTIGEPADIVDEEDAELSASEEKTRGTYSSPLQGRKSLFRNPDDRIIAGVCSGLGAYFDIDPVVFRVIAGVSTLISAGFVPFIYIVLWIAMPKAKTLSQRIEMRGGITFKAMGDNIKEEYQAVSSKFNDYKNKPVYRRMQSRANKTGDAMADGLRQFLNIFGIILGIGIVIWSILSIMALVGFFVFKDTVLSLVITEGNLFLTSLPDRILSFSDQILLSSSVVLLAGIPLLVILYLGLKLIFRFKGPGKIIGLSAFAVWLSAVVLLCFTGMHLVKSYEEEGSVTNEYLLKPTEADTIYLRVADTASRTADREYLMDIDRLELFAQDEHLSIEGAPIIKIERGDRVKLNDSKHARGYTDPDAEFNARNTAYAWSQNDSIIYLDKCFFVGSEALVRQQKVYVNIQIPHDKKLEVSPYLDRFINEY